MAAEKDAGTAMLISTVLPGGGQVWVQAFGSAFSVWVGLLIVGAGVVAGVNMQDGAKSAAQRATNQDELDQAQADYDMGGNVKFWSWVLVLIVWGANIYDAKKETNKYNARRATTPSGAALPVADPLQGKSAMADSSGHNDASSRLMRLAELRKAGALTEEEFQAKKKELLGRI